MAFRAARHRCSDTKRDRARRAHVDGSMRGDGTRGGRSGCSPPPRLAASPAAAPACAHRWVDCENAGSADHRGSATHDPEAGAQLACCAARERRGIARCCSTRAARSASILVAHRTRARAGGSTWSRSKPPGVGHTSDRMQLTLQELSPPTRRGRRRGVASGDAAPSASADDCAAKHRELPDVLATPRRTRLGSRARGLGDEQLKLPRVLTALDGDRRGAFPTRVRAMCSTARSTDTVGLTLALEQGRGFEDALGVLRLARAGCFAATGPASPAEASRAQPVDAHAHCREGPTTGGPGSSPWA